MHESTNRASGTFHFPVLAHMGDIQHNARQVQQLRGVLLTAREHKNAPNKKLYVMLAVAFVPNIRPALSSMTPIDDIAMDSKFSPTVRLARANDAAWHATFMLLISSMDQCH